MRAANAVQGQDPGKPTAAARRGGLLPCWGEGQSSWCSPWKVTSSVWERRVNPTAQTTLDPSLRVPEVRGSRHREMERNGAPHVGLTKTAHFALTPRRWIHSLLDSSLNHSLLLLLTITLPWFILLPYKQEVLTIDFQKNVFLSRWPCAGDGVLSWVVWFLWALSPSSGISPLACRGSSCLLLHGLCPLATPFTHCSPPALPVHQLKTRRCDGAFISQRFPPAAAREQLYLVKWGGFPR